MTDKFKGGEVVQLKSGGPVMTVSHYSASSETYVCQWFDKNDLKASKFPENSLELYVETPMSDIGIF
ncbi:YodC family protein [Citrobacter werkmanii]|uniref:YodC family protein n=1 Tax=Citrobacter werkmanii TaxID=67827 RepID=UPI0026514DED|nr:DUF2158 domain-containing protein [Citrobacter werkmanii]MDN8559321.1 DUF2158 domain-containing protein [Citrobacter werkmanii]